MGWFLVHVAARYGTELIWGESWVDAIPFLGFLLLAGRWWTVSADRSRTPLLAAAALFKAAVLGWREFPTFSNHSSLEMLVLLLGALGAAEDLPLDAALKSLPGLALVWSAVQKVAYGVWIRGTFPLWLSVQRPALASAFHLLGVPIPPSHGPFVAASVWPAFLGTTALVAEAAAGAAVLVLPAQRTASAAIGALVVLLGLELVAGEWQFGLLMAGLLVLAVGDLWENRRTLVAFLAGDAMLVLWAAFSRWGAHL
ncbi:MAG TPA: hypothetical protein VL588_12085 [Bdellovibrionota bacterium]|jgi:hypothetical protein|nr:hypothetical protein [Bdellovibrionota bacterium]